MNDVCTCGHEKDDHLDIYLYPEEHNEAEICLVKDCPCCQFKVAGESE